MTTSYSRSLKQLNNQVIEAYSASSSDSGLSLGAIQHATNRHVVRIMVNDSILIFTLTDMFNVLYEIKLTQDDVLKLRDALGLRMRIEDFIQLINTTLTQSSISMPAIVMNKHIQNAKSMKINVILPVNTYQTMASLELKRVAYFPSDGTVIMNSSSNRKRQRTQESINTIVADNGFPDIEIENNEDDNDVNLLRQTIRDISFAIFDQSASKPSSKPSIESDTQTPRQVASSSNNDTTTAAAANEALRRLKEELAQEKAKNTALQSQLDSRPPAVEEHLDPIDVQVAEAAAKKKIATSNRSAINPNQRRRQKKGFVIGGDSSQA